MSIAMHRRGVIAASIMGNSTPVEEVDPYWDKVILNLTCEGSNTTDLIDTSNNAIHLTRTGSVGLTTSEFKYGSSSLDLTFDGYYRSPTSGFDFSPKSAPFCIRTFFKIKTATTSDGSRIASVGGGAGVVNNTTGFGWFLGHKANPNVVQFVWSNGVTLYEVVAPYVLNTWHHLEVDYDGAKVYLFLDGVLIETSTSPLVSPSSPAYFEMGSLVGQTQTTARLMNGYIDGFQIMHGAARHTNNFTPPTRDVGPTTP